MFHVNPATGKPGKCSAKNGNCPFGDDTAHYFNPEAAQKAFEASQADKLMPQPASKASGPDLTVYTTTIARTRDPEVYVHPQGKVAIVNDDGTLSIFKNGLPAKSSGTLDQLRSGRGSWKAVPYDEIPGASAKKSAAAAPTDPEELRKQALVAAGMPATSTLDPTKTGGIKQEQEVIDRTGYSRVPSSILPVDERFNPHSGISNSEWIPVWSDPGRPATIEVWKAEDSDKSYKLVATSGPNTYKLGSRSKFAHDQSGARMGNTWKLIGAFQGEDGGEVIGEVPNRKMPVYTYK